MSEDGEQVYYEDDSGEEEYGQEEYGEEGYYEEGEGYDGEEYVEGQGYVEGQEYVEDKTNQEEGEAYVEEGEYQEKGEHYVEEGEHSGEEGAEEGENYEEEGENYEEEGEVQEEEGEEIYEQQQQQDDDGEAYRYDDEDESVPEEDLPPLEDFKVVLKPRCNVLGSVKEFRTNDNVGSVELSVYKNWLRDAPDEEVWALFDSLGQAPRLKKVTILSKGSANQSLPVTYLCHLIGEAIDLEEFRSLHIKWTGEPDEFDVLAGTVAEHTRLKVLQLHMETIDFLETTIEAAGQVMTLEEVEIQTTTAATDKTGLKHALESLCTSPSLRILKLVHVTVKFEVIANVARLLGANEALEELYIQATELDLKGGIAMAQMLAANPGLKSCILKLDKMHGTKIGDAFIQALGRNTNIQYFQIILDGRMSDMAVSSIGRYHSFG